MTPEMIEKNEQDPKELELAEQKAREEAERDTAVKFTLKLITPIEYEAELNAQGIVVISPSYQSPYLVRLCARACSTPIDVDLIKRFKLRDYLALRNKARNFLMSSEQ